MKVLVLLSLLASMASAISFYDVVVEEFSTWKMVHGREYKNPTEEKFRLKIYMENKKMIEKHNARFHRGEVTYSLKMNHFGDLLHHEFRSTMNGYRHDLKNRTLQNRPLGSFYVAPEGITLPKTVDWRTKGAVTPVKNQGQCGSCWAFSTTGSLEGQHFRKTGKLVSLSEQNLVDCATSEGNHGCNGGLMDYGFQYVKDAGGIDTEESYPYVGHEKGECDFNPKTIGATDTGFVDVPEGDEDKMAVALATVGPLAVAIDAENRSFQFYHDGVYSDAACSPERLDHGVLAVGFGTDEQSGKKYWLVKNSWGESWGDQGYVKMLKDENNSCGIASSASYPLV